MASQFGEGDRLGNLEIGRELGRGAFGVVYHAQDTVLKREVALKVFRAPGARIDPRERNRILTEAQLICRILSPHVVTLFRIHELDDGDLAYEMEYVAGGTLGQLLRRADPPDPTRALEILRGIASGLKAVHDAGVVHGDVKPGNVLLDGNGTPKIADFGLGHFFLDPAFSSAELGPVGTPRYMAPEVGMGHRPTIASDLWSFGVLLYRMLTGRLPFDGGNLCELFLAVQNQPMPRLGPEVAPTLAQLAERCLRKHPAQRLADPAQALEVLESASAVPLAATPVILEPRFTGGFQVGRDQERTSMAQRLEYLARGDGYALLITGDPGIGKTTLVQELEATARERGLACINVQLSPMLGLLRPLIAALEQHTSGAAERHPVDSQQQLVWIVESLVEAITAQSPLVLVLEDLHHADSGDARLLAGIARRLRQLPVLLCGTMRPLDFDDSVAATTLLAAPEFEQIGLDSLADDAILAILENDCGEVRIGALVARRIVDLAHGNPLFAKEILRDLRERNTIVLEQGRLRPGHDWREMRAPQRIQDVVARRVREMEPHHRALLDVAAVDGFTFDGNALAVALEEPLLRVLRNLQQIYRERGVVIPHREGYNFSHPLVQEVLYDEVAPALRVATHRRLAEHLEALPVVDAERVGVHWERAGETRRARPHLLQAGCEAADRQEILRAIDLFERAGLPGDAGTGDADALLSYCICLCDRGRHQEADEVYAWLLRFARERGDEELELHTIIDRAHKLVPARGLEVVDESLLRHATQTLPDSRQKALAHRILGLAHRIRGELDDAREEFLAAVQVYEVVDHASGMASALDSLATISALTGDLAAADEQYARASELARSVGARSNAAISDVNRALRLFQGGKLEGLVPALESAIRTLELEGAAGSADHARMILSHVFAAEGATRQALTTARAALGGLERSGNLQALNAGHVAVSQLAGALGGLEEAADHARQAREFADRANYTNGRVYAETAAMRVCCFGGDPHGGALAANEALRHAREAGTMVRDELLGQLAEAMLYGLPSEVLEDAPASTDPEIEEMRAGVMALRQGGPPEPIEQAARHLLATSGESRAERLVLGHWLNAEASLLRGQLAEARRTAQQALEDARALGHVWHVASIERRFADLL